MAFDKLTQVLTTSGWKFWPDVTGSEEFVSRDVEGFICYKKTDSFIKEFEFKTMHALYGNDLDLLVTGDQKIFIRPAYLTPRYTSVSEIDRGLHFFYQGVSVREQTNKYSKKQMAFIGFAIATGSGSVTFTFNSEKEIYFFNDLCHSLGLAVDGKTVEWPFDFPFTPGKIPTELASEKNIESLISGACFRPVSNLDFIKAHSNKLFGSSVSKETYRLKLATYSVDIPVYVKRCDTISVWC